MRAFFGNRSLEYEANRDRGQKNQKEIDEIVLKQVAQQDAQ